MHRLAWLLMALAPVLNGCAGWQGLKLVLAGDNVELRDVPGPENTDAPDILFLAMDGVDRDLLYDMWRAGELPELAKLLGVSNGPQNEFEHAYFAPGLHSTLPSSTGVAWATMITGVSPAEHGVAGNEYFIRKTREFAAPVPVTVDKVDPVLRIYTEGYANHLLQAPTVYEQLREREPGIRIAVVMHQFYAGADELILTDRSALVEAFGTFINDEAASLLSNDQSLTVFSEIDAEIFENVSETIDVGDTPDVITVYIPGIDHFAHISDLGPDEARRRYLREAVEPLIAALREELIEDDELANRYIVISSDHGHTQVLHDDEHSLYIDAPSEPPALLESAGYTLRPFALNVPDDTYFDTVLAYQGALAYVYVANQATCPVSGQLCDWEKPARAQDINAVAELFYTNNRDGKRVPQLRDVLDMVLVRKRTWSSNDETSDTPVFEVYTGAGSSQPIETYLAAHPHPEYIEMPERLRALTEGPFGDHAGDVILVAHNGDRKQVEQRYYFASLYHSWHGSPSAKDSQVPLIVAHPEKSNAQLRTQVEKALAQDHSLAAVTQLLLDLRQSTTREQAH